MAIRPILTFGGNEGDIHDIHDIHDIFGSMSYRRYKYSIYL
jgi:hypothetical protein